MHEVLVNRLGGLSLPRKSVVRLTDRPDMTLDVYCGRKTTMQQQQQKSLPFLKWLRFSCISNMAVCVYSNSRNDVPRVAQQYGTIAAHTRCHGSVFVVFIVFACTCTALPV